MQGSVLAPIKTSVQIDSIGKECSEKGENIYLYKNSVPIPPLSFIDDIAAFSKCGLNSIKMNTFLNTKIEMKKLQLNKEKCKKLHFGKSNLICPELNVHGSEMKISDCEKYLGNLISTDMNNKKMIDARVNMGIGCNAQIMSLLNDISLGHHYFKISKILREAMLINGILFSANAWYNVSEQNLRYLEQVDESLLCQILKAHSKTPLEALYLELGCLPIRFVLMARRINFLYYILSLDKSDLLWKEFEAQMKNPVKGEWYLQVLEDLKNFNKTTEFDEIKKISKLSFKKIVQNESKIAALNYLNNLKKRHSKCDNISFDKVEIQPYLNSEEIYPQMAQQIFKWRTRMVNFKCNFRNGNDDISCPLGCDEDDLQENILNCQIIIAHLPEILTSNIKYSDIFSSDIMKMKSAGALLSKAFEKRASIIDLQ